MTFSPRLSWLSEMVVYISKSFRSDHVNHFGNCLSYSIATDILNFQY